MNSYDKFQKEIILKLEQGLERSLYGSLEGFLTGFIKDKFDRKVFIISEQSSKNYDDKKIGIPDIAIKENDLTVGYIEVKLPGDSLDHKKFQNQFNRYRDSLENIIFTNLKEWQLWQWNEKEESVKHQKTLYFDVQNFDENNLEELQTWLQPFLFFQPQPIKNTQQLAKNLAKKTKLLTTTLVDIYEESEQLKNVKTGFETTLLHSISPEDFAGIIAETLTYSLFVASLEHLQDLDSKNSFQKLTLTTAIDYIPSNIPVLHDLYQLTKNSTSKNHQLAEVLEQIINQLNNTDLVKIRDSFFADSTKTDPILYFYEDFLSEIDSDRKKKRGVYYTPKPLVDFIVGGVDFLLENKLKLNKGLLNQEVKLLDPATGTGTFLVSSLENIVNKINNEMGGTGLEKSEITKAIKNHFIPNFFALEFLVSSYTIAHLKLFINLQKIGYSGKERINIYLANTLDNPNNPISQLVGLENITQESETANKIKKDKNIIAIIGNPPYSGSSQNPSKIGKNLTYIGGLIEDYKKGLVGEKNPKWIQDDYVKFIRFAHKKIDEAGQGVIGYVVPHGFLDNPTFRIMRKKLLESFDEIYIVDLHGNNKKKETAPDGSKDENVFNIEQGVCILWMVKNSDKKNFPIAATTVLPLAKVFHHDIFGKRKAKIDFLSKKTIENIQWEEVQPQDEMFYFIPRDYEKFETYKKFWSVKDIFEVNGVGITTAHDNFVIDTDKERLIQTFEKFKKSPRDENYLHEHFDVAKKAGWNILAAWDNLQKIEKIEDLIEEISYRPFDTRYIIYEDKLVWRTVRKVMQHFLNRENLGLFSTRFQFKKNIEYSTIFAGKNIVDINFIQSPGTVQIFPLYTYNIKAKDGLDFEAGENNSNETKKINFTAEFTDFWKNHDVLKDFDEKEIFGYIYGLLHSQKYRDKWAEFLKTDFPRINFDLKNGDMVVAATKFKKISELGSELIKWHLLEHSDLEKLGQSGLRFGFEQVEIETNDFVIDFKKKSEILRNNRIYLNPKTYLESSDGSDLVEVYNFVIGGYQVVEKYLTSYKNQIIDPQHFMKIVWSLKETIKIINLENLRS